PAPALQSMAALEYTEAVLKGQHLLHLLTSPQPPTQSPFTTYPDLENHGYVDQLASSTPRPTIAPLQKCLRSLGVDDKLAHEDGKNVSMQHVHAEDCVVDETQYPATEAHFHQLVSSEQGVLIAYSNHAPAYTGVLHDPPVTTYPPLHHWSDIAFLQLLKPAVYVPPNLHYIIRYAIQNMATISVLKHVLAKQGIEKLDIWPGITLGMESEEGQAILGTPNGGGTAWLLAQHRRQLGRKTVDKVSVFYAENGKDVWRWPSLVFWLKDLDEEN
ncbi:hypothetical protein BU26DRAFT_395261, partial [Trematosphaeria pertusa]